MSRSRPSARRAGTAFESLVAGYLAGRVDERVERRVRTGAKDRGDISGLRSWGNRVVVECKDVTRMDLAGWVAEAEVQRGNDDATVGLVIHKRRGKAQPGDQYVTMTVRDLVALLTGARPGEEG